MGEATCARAGPPPPRSRLRKGPSPMSFADRVAVAVPPILLRLVLAVTFFWAGLGKVVETQEFQGDAAARLANMGIEPMVAAPAPSEDASPSESDLPVEPLNAEARGEADASAFVRTQDTAPVPPAVDPPPALPDPTPSIPAPPAPLYTSADFPEPVSFKRVHGLALLVDRAANPSPNPDGTVPEPFWPAWAGQNSWPVVLAWAAVATELLGAVLLVFGFLTRLAGLSLAGTMVAAAWLTQIGPAMQAGDTVLGFLPSYAAFDVAAWTPLLWQFALFGAGLALLFSGGGALSLDRVGRRDDDDEEESS